MKKSLEIIEKLNPIEQKTITENKWNRKFFKFGKIRLHAVIADNAPKKSPILLLLHGFPEFWFSWRYLMPELSKYYHVIALDQRGYNLSSKPFRVSKYSTRNLVKDALHVIKQEAVDYYVRECGLNMQDDIVKNPSVVLIGHDWGGAVSYEIARYSPQYVFQLIVLNCPPVEILLREVTRNISQLLKSYYIFLFQIPFVGEFFLNRFKGRIFGGIAKLNPDNDARKHISGYLNAYSYRRSNSVLNWYRSALRQSLVEIFHKPPKINCNTKIIWGTADQALDVSLVKGITEVVEKKNLHVTFLPGISHWIQQEAPDIVLEQILDFLKPEEKKYQDEPPGMEIYG